MLTTKRVLEVRFYFINAVLKPMFLGKQWVYLTQKSQKKIKKSLQTNIFNFSNFLNSTPNTFGGYFNSDFF